MPWHNVTIERQVLYREVWQEPMTKLSKRYGISDVGLRKVCAKLNVPVPVAGHWTKVHHGKRTNRPALPVICQHEHHVIRSWVDPVAGRLEARLAALPPESPRTQSAADVIPPRDVAECRRSVRNTATALAKSGTDERGRLLSAGRGAIEVRVSAQTQVRSVLLCELLMRGLEAAGLPLEERLASGDAPRVLAGTYWYTWRVTEVGIQPPGLQRERTESAPRDGKRRRGQHAVGALRLDFLQDGQRAIALTCRDNASGRLESRIGAVVSSILQTAAVAKVKADLVDEERQEAEARWQDKVRRIARRNAELEALKSTEELAEQFRRAAALRAYAEAIQVRSFEQQALSAEARDERVMWIQRAADWLDPTTKQHWPDVDDAPANPW